MLTFIKSVLASVIAVVFLTMGAASADQHGMNKNIVGTAVGAGNFNTLISAVKAAGLADTLSESGPFTVFAPTDEAFAKLPAGTLEDLLKPENKAQLVAILTYHVVPGKVMSGDIAGKRADVATVQGSPIDVDATGGNVKVNEANVVAADVMASNGIIHVIDTVILPPNK